jgi:Protein of unknown function (DUF2442)
MAKMKMSEEFYSEAEIRQQFKEATRRAAEADHVELRAARARFDKKTSRIVVELTTGVVVTFPPALLQGLEKASQEDLAAVVVSPQGTSLHWERLDADFSVSGLLTGIFGTRTWMSALGRKGGCVISEAKAKAARLNGHRGGRPAVKIKRSEAVV